MYYVYVLQSLKTGELYKGLAADINNRLEQHLLGEVAFTKTRFPLRLIHVEICKDRNEARKVEKFLKSGYGREILRELVDVVK